MKEYIHLIINDDTPKITLEFFKPLKQLSKEEERISSRLEGIKKGANKRFLRRIHKKPPLTVMPKWKKPVEKVKVKKRVHKELRGLAREEDEILKKIQHLTD